MNFGIYSNKLPITPIHPTNLVSQGGYSNVYSIYEDGIFYALKVFKVLKHFQTECELLPLFNQHQIGPQMIASNPSEMSIQMEMWDGTLEDHLNVSREIVSKLQTQIQTLHQLGYFHGDITLKNVLIKKKDGKVNDITLCDFGGVTSIQSAVLDPSFLYYSPYKPYLPHPTSDILNYDKLILKLLLNKCSLKSV